jgi:hypothetical protein
MFQRFLALGAVFALVLTLGACGGSGGESLPASGSVSSTPESSSQESAPAEVPQADDELVGEIVMRYGALPTQEGAEPGTYPIIIAGSFFYLNESWDSPEEISAAQYFSWYYTGDWGEDWETQQELYPSPIPGATADGSDSVLYPQDVYEGRIQEYFEVSSDHLRSDSAYYRADYQGYSANQWSAGKGLAPLLNVVEYTQEGDLLTIQVDESNAVNAPRNSHLLTVRLEPDGGWKYLSCQVTPIEE